MLKAIETGGVKLALIGLGYVGLPLALSKILIPTFSWALTKKNYP